MSSSASDARASWHAYSDAQVAALYDVVNAWDASDDWYLAQVSVGAAVLDVGCGTGQVLRRARADGHAGRLVGLDPDEAALAVARREPGVEWVTGTAASMPWAARFDVATMGGNAFQCLVTDEDVDASLVAVRRALVPGGRFAFGTRNPSAREWERWTPDHPFDVVDPQGRALRMVHRVESVAADRVTVTETTQDADDGEVLRVDRSTLRFLAADAIAARLAAAGFDVLSQQGGYAGQPLTDGSAHVVTVAVAAATLVG